jgi:acetolactate synthase I/III small subunit
MSTDMQTTTRERLRTDEQPEAFEKHTISLYVANKPGVLIRIALVFARRGYNIDSLVVSPAPDQDFSTMNIVASGDRKTLDQILKQLNKLVDVVHATDRTNDDVINRELALIKVHCEPELRGEVLQLSKALDCETVDLGERSVTIQATGNSEKLDAVSRVFERYGLLEMMRTGKVVIARGETITP